MLDFLAAALNLQQLQFLEEKTAKLKGLDKLSNTTLRKIYHSKHNIKVSLKNLLKENTKQNQCLILKAKNGRTIRENLNFYEIIAP